MAADLEFRIGAELTEIKGALAGLQRDLQGVGRAAQQAGGNNAFRSLETSARGAVGTVGRLAAGFVTLAGAVQAIGAADELNNLNARLRIATKSTEEYIRAQAALFELSQRTRSSLGETVGLYSQIANATKDAGVGQETLLQVVETINQAVQLSGASAQAAQAALVQLGQGLASGTLRGEELNSILEQTPALADAIAKGMGITRGELRKYGEEGKITSQQVIEALQNQREEVAKNFQELPVTVGQSITLLRNAGLQIIGAFDQASGATGGLASAIKSLADFLSSDAVLGAVTEFAATWGNALKQIADDAGRAFEFIRSSFTQETDAIGDAGESLLQFIGRAFRELPVNIRTAIQIITVQAAAMFDRLINNATLVKDVFKAIFTDDTVDAAFERFKTRSDAINFALQSGVDQSFAERDAALAEARKAREEAQRRREQGRQNTGANGLGTFANRPSDAQTRAAAQLEKARLDALEKLQDDSSKRQLATLEQQFNDSQLAAAEYYRRREELELAAVDRAIAVEQQRAGGGGVEAIKAQAEIEILERRKTDIRNAAVRDRVEFERNLEQQLSRAKIQDLENGGDTAQAARLKIEAQYQELIARLQAEGDTAGVAIIKKLINTEVAQAEFKAIKDEFDRVTNELRARQQQIANQRDTGGISGEAATQQESAARQKAAAELDVLNAKLQELALRTKDGAIVQGAQQASAAIQQLAIDSATGVDAAVIQLRSSIANMERDFARTAASAGVDAMTNLFTDLAEGSKSAGEALTDFVRGFAASMAQMAARALATYAVLQLLETFFPGAGRALAASGSVSAGVNHRGGMVGGASPRRNVSPLLFAGAPRYHSGGMVGLKPDERPAILQTGEEVLARNDPRNQANGGAGGGGGTRIINVIDPAMVSDYMSSSAGEKTILNVLQRNSGAVRQVLS